MPKQQIKQSRSIHAQRFDFTVKTVRALSNGSFVDGGEFKVSHLGDARDAADRLQEEFDADCDPCRTYVYGNGPVPIYAGLARYSNGGSHR